MFVRLTFCKLIPEKVNEARRVYTEEIMPTVRKQKGLINIRFFEPVNKTDEYISITEWTTETDAEMYVNTGLYKRLVNKLERFFLKNPELKMYTVEEIFEHA